MLIQTTLKDYAGERQSKLQLLNSEKKNWRLYWNTQKEPATPYAEGETATEQWSADYVPQPFQEDVISNEEPSPEAFRTLLAELGMSESEIEAIIDE